MAIDLEGKNLLVLGVARSGQAVVELALKHKCNIYVYDKNSKKLKEFVKNYQKNSKNVNFLRKIAKKSIFIMDYVVVSPSIKLSNSLLKFCKSNDIMVMSELEFGSNFCKAPIFAITGTNGKTTTSTLLYNIFSSISPNAFLLGNVGVPLSAYAETISSDSYIVCETSSYQLENIISFRPKIASILNFGIDHLSYHKTLDNYYKAKLNIFRNMTKQDFAVINYDDKRLVAFTNNLKCKTYYFSLTQPVLGCYIQDNIIKFTDGKIAFDIMDIPQIKLIGKHNLYNILCAITMALLAGVSRQAIAEVVSNFKTLANRLEFVKISKGVTYINDSKATNIESTLSALEALKNSRIILLLGGSDKGEKFKNLFKNHYPNIKEIICYGATKNKIFRSAKKFNYHPHKAKHLLDAIKLAQNLSAKGDTILLSPACASFDEFENFEKRGEFFKKTV